jgi:MFS family permease
MKFVLLLYLELQWDKVLFGILVSFMNFMKTVMSIDSSQVDTLLGVALILGTPFSCFGWLSDKVGRKYIMMGGMLLAILLYRPIYKQMYETTSVKNKTEMVENYGTC